VLAFASAAWSIDAPLTLGRALTLLALFVTCASLAYAAAGRPDDVGIVLLGVLAGAVVVALLGLANLWADSDRALVPATRITPARYNGLGGNPNTMAMLFALALPIAVWTVVEARSRLGKVAAVAVVLLFEGSLAASGSRGAAIGALAGTLALAVVAGSSGRLRVALVVVALALFGANVALAQVPQPAERDPIDLNPEFGTYVPLSKRDAQGRLPLESEIGFPGVNAKGERRSLFETSGRFPGWVGAVEQAAQRPVAGYGFGTEERAFVDRYYRLYSSRPENSYLGTALQLGAVGVVALLVLLGALLVRGVRGVGALPQASRRVAGACLGAVVCGLVLAFTQSYVTSVGSPATFPFWLCAFLLVAVRGDGEPT
jgi:hypothetical protein